MEKESKTFEWEHKGKQFAEIQGQFDTKITILLNSSHIELFFMKVSEIAENFDISLKYKRENL